MVKKIVSKVMWVGRATVFLVGLTVIFAIVLGVATTAMAHSGSKGLFHLGHDNPVTSLTSLTGSVANGVLQVTNQSTGNTTQDATAVTATNNSAGSPTIRATNAKGSPAMELNVGCPNLLQCNRGAPMTVNSAAKVDNLNADLLDGKDSTEFLYGYQAVSKETTATDSTDRKGVAVDCPQDPSTSTPMLALGGGYRINLYDNTGADGHVVVTGSWPANFPPNGWNVNATEIGTGTTSNWSLTAHVICAHSPAPPLP